MKCLHTLLLLLVVTGSAWSQLEQPVRWSFDASALLRGEARVTFKAAIEDGWHIYSQFIEEGGPIPTTFTFSPDADYALLGNVKEESTPVETFDQTFGMHITWFSDTAVFSQTIRLHVPESTVKGTIEYMVCNDLKCLPPEEVEFTIPVQGGVDVPLKTKPTRHRDTVRDTVIAAAKAKDPVIVKAPVEEPVTEKSRADTTVADAPASSVSPTSVIQTTALPQKTSLSLWAIFWGSFLGGIAAIFMPCIFPMLPFTISFFMKAKSKTNALVRAGIYGLSIVSIYVTLGLIITVLFGADALNDLSTSGVFNLFFFLLLVAFAASFLGAFEITLPSRWVNAVDSMADRSGAMQLFLMAATLSLVSFSCTGPIIGTLLVEAASTGRLLGPAVGMLGFSTALSMPFMAFALFPAALNKLPKAGGWLNNVKVVLGFLELALALKFLSNVDLAYHWNWFDREVFLVLWIIIFGLLGFYLLGKITLPHDTPQERISPVRLLLSIVVLAFTLYMIPGLWGAPLKAVSAFLPPQQTQDFDLHTRTVGSDGAIYTAGNKYSDIFHAPHGLNAFFDYAEGLAYARRVNKPVLLDFTGHACVNCRKMETTVWAADPVLKRLRQDVVLIQLYVDDKTLLPDGEQRVSPFSGKKIRTIGNKWSDFQALRFNTNSQPYYVLLDTAEKLLATPQGADYDVANFIRFIDNGLEAFHGSKN